MRDAGSVNFPRQEEPVLDTLSMSVFSKAGFFIGRPVSGHFSREKIGENGKNSLDSGFLCTLLVPSCLFCEQRPGIRFNFCAKLINY
jgi:hypothetical protein